MPRFKYTLESGNERLIKDQRTVRLLETGRTVNDKSLFICNVCENKWLTSFNHVYGQKRGCPKCSIKQISAKRSIPETLIRAKLESKNVELLYYGGTCSSMSKFKCKTCDYFWETFVHNVCRNKKGCPKCANSIKLTLEDCKEKLKGRPLDILEYSGKSSTHSKFRCHKCSNIWSAKYNNVSQGQNCPSCAKSGFKSNKPAYVYIFLLDTVYGDCYGFGISNNLKSRLRAHYKNLKNCIKKEYEPKYFEEGKLAQEVEKAWKMSPHLVDIGITGFRTECVKVNEDTTRMIFG